MKLLEHFKELSLYPKNADELKGLILQLAVQGKLTTNWREDNPDVEPASVLLKKIEVEKNQLIIEKKLKKNKKLDDIQESEKYFTLPNTWSWERLENIGNIFNGNSVNKSIKEAKYTGLETGYPYIATKDVGYSFDKIDHNNGVKIPFDEPKFKVARKGTVLICSEGGSAGKKMGLLEEDCCFGNKLYAIEQYGGIESLYILSLYGTASFSQAFRNKMTGIIGGISKNNFASLLIPLPPIEEQKAIVEIVNTLFAEVEQLETLTKERIQLKESFVVSALNKLVEAENTQQEWNFLQKHFSNFFTEKKNIKSLRETILQLAVQGKLTEGWRANNPNTEPASELLKRIEAEKQQLIAEKKIRKEKPLPPINEDEMPYELPEGWVWCRFQEIFDIRDGTHDSPKDSLDKVTYPLVTSKNFNNGEIDFDSARRISEEDYLKVIQRSKVHKGDILFSMIGGNIGNQVEVGDFTEYAIKNVALFKHYKYGLPEEGFLKVFSKYIAMSLQSEASGGAQPFVSLKFFRSLILGLPSAEEQKEIVEKVNSLMTLCDELEQQIETNQTQIEQLMQSCLKEVFEYESN